MKHLLIAGLAVAMILGCAAKTFERPITDCQTMSEEELRTPIYAQGFALFEDFGGYRRIVIVAEAGLDAEGYVTNPRIARAWPTQRFNEQVLEAVSTWRYCPEYAAQLAGERFEIPFDMKVKKIRTPMPGY